MAIDPATAKALAKLALAAATDEDARKKILAAIIGIVTFLLVMTAFLVCLITSPLSMFAKWFGGEDLAAVDIFQQEYGYNQSIGIFESDYLFSGKEDYEGITFTDASVEVVYYNQMDGKFKQEPYGTDKIGSHGCGPTAMAIVIASLTGDMVDPVGMAQWSVDNGHWCAENGSYHSLIPAAAAAWGLPVEGIKEDEPEKVVEALSSGKLVVAIMSKGHFTNGGHFIVLWGITENGSVLVADPASYKRSEKEWELDIIMNEAKKRAGAGGPFWAIG